MAKSAGTSKKNQAANYKTLGKAAKNKAVSLARHKAAHPAEKQCEGIKLAHTRKAPNNKGGWLTGKMTAQLVGYTAINPNDKECPSLSKSRAVLKRLAQHMKFDKGVRNESAYTMKKNTQASRKQKAA